MVIYLSVWNCALTFFPCNVITFHARCPTNLSLSQKLSLSPPFIISRLLLRGFSLVPLICMYLESLTLPFAKVLSSNYELTFFSRIHEFLLHTIFLLCTLSFPLPPPLPSSPAPLPVECNEPSPAVGTYSWWKDEIRMMGRTLGDPIRPNGNVRVILYSKSLIICTTTCVVSIFLESW